MIAIDVAIVGAGPNGLALALELASSRLTVKLIGHPMAFWSKIAGAADGRYLKSFGSGANISTSRTTSFTDWSRARGLETFEPCAIASFADYGRWLQTTLIPNVITSNVAQVSPHQDGFLLRLDNDEQYVARRVVFATGLSGFQHIPPELRQLPETLCTHSSAIDDFARFRGQTVAVIGAGQSALEATTLLFENGAEAELLAREPHLRWMARLSASRSVFQRVRRPISSLGIGLKSWVLVHVPRTFLYLPKKMRAKFFGGHLPPEGAWWLRDRCEKAGRVSLSTTVLEARTCGGRVDLFVQAGDMAPVWRRFDHVIAATGFRVDVAKLDIIDATMRASIRCTAGSPNLDRSFQSSVPGLYFVGPAAAESHGPLVRFVAGVGYAAPVVASHIQLNLAQPSARLARTILACRAFLKTLFALDRGKPIRRKLPV